MRTSVLLLAAMVIFSAGLLAFKYTEPENLTYTIEYKVSCRQCVVNYRDENGLSKDVVGVSQSWSYRFTGVRGQFIYISAMDTLGGPVKVSIWKNDREFSSDQSKVRSISARTGTIL